MTTAAHRPEAGRRESANPGPVPDNNQPGDTRPYLCIPYWEGPRFPGDAVDIGQLRPLPPGIVSWECPGIHATPYMPGEELEVTVDVRNSGNGSATAVATVVVYWASPTVGFTKPTLFGVAAVAAPTMRDPLEPGVASVTLRALIPATAPEHICLLASVTHSFDPAPPLIDPVGDRHWAQRNLVAVSASVSPIIVPFLAANPLDVEGLFDLKARLLGRRELELLALRLKAEPGELALRMRLVDALGNALGNAATGAAGEPVTRLVLCAGRQRRFSLVLEFAQSMPASQLVAVELSLTQSGDPPRAVGSLGIVIHGAAACS